MRFLDWANGRLDRAIRAKRKVIALLNEQKQAIIHRAVTRGLDPSGPSNPPAGDGLLIFQKTGKRYRCEGHRGGNRRPALFSGLPDYRNTVSVSTEREGKPLELGRCKVYQRSGSQGDFAGECAPKLAMYLYTKGGTTGVARAVDLAFPFQVWVHIAVLKLNRQRIYRSS